MKNRIALLLSVLSMILIGGCSLVHSPDRIGDLQQPTGSDIYNQSGARSHGKQPGQKKVREVSVLQADRKSGARDIEEPAPLVYQPTAGGTEGVDHASGEIVSRGVVPRPAVLDTGNTPEPLNELEAGEVVHLDYEQVDLRRILEEIAGTLGISLSIDPTLSGKVTMRTSRTRPLHKKDLWPVLQMLLDEAGVSLERKGNIFQATRKPVLLPEKIVMAGDEQFPVSTRGNMDGRVLQFIALRNVAAKKVVEVLSPLLQPHGKILTLPNLNVIGVIAAPYILDRVYSLIPLLDADPFTSRGIRIYKLHKAKSKDVAVELEKVMRMIAGEYATYKVLDLQRLNSILVVAPPERGFQQIEKWVGILDDRNNSDYEQVFVYNVKNLKAGNLADTLTRAFPTDHGAVGSATVRSRVQPQDKSGEKNTKEGEKTTDKPEAGGMKPPSPPAVPAEGGPVNGRAGINADLRLTIVADEDTNTLLVRSTARDYQRLLQTISQLDTPPLEVMCNIVIAEVLLNEQNEFGIDWYLLSKYGDALLGTPFDVTDGLKIPGAENRNIMEVAHELTGQFTEKGLIMKGVGGGQLGTVLRAISSVGNLKVLSRPSILVRNNKEALIKVGTEEPILTSVTNSDVIAGGQTAIQNDVQYRDTGIILTVKPHITKDDIIHMEVKQEISKLGDNRTIYDLPSFDSSKVETSVVVQNGSAIILGGIIRTQNRSEKDGLPFLSDLPLVGPLFATTKNNEYRYELVLIIVPEIIDPQDRSDTMVDNFLSQMRQVESLIDEKIGLDNFQNR